MQLEDLSGRRFHYLVVGHRVKRAGDRRTYWRCRCDCGEAVTVWAANLKNGHTRSCGCLVSEANTVHGQSRTREFRIWSLMIRRCTNPSSDSFRNYGGRGIAVCDRWRQSFTNFLTDMGRAPSLRHKIDRIDNDGNYEPGNCRWATQRDQARNTRVNRLLTFQGETLPAIVWCERLGLQKNCLLTRLRRGWSVEEALTRPVQKKQA